MFNKIDNALGNPSLRDIGAFFLVLVGLAVLLIVLIKVVRARQERANDAEHIYTSSAKVVEKQELPPNTVRSVSQMWVVFELQDGRRLRLYTRATDLICVGDEGRLEWQGTRVNFFTRNK